MFPTLPNTALTLCLMTVGLSSTPLGAAQTDSTTAQQAILAQIQPPEFPSRDFSIADFGASAEADCTEALAKAIAACHAAGGGRVVIPAGTWVTGAVHLLGNVNLHVAKERRCASTLTRQNICPWSSPASRASSA